MIPDILRFQDQLVDSVSLLGSAAQVLSGEIELSPAPEVELPKSPFFTRTVLMLSLEDRVAYQAAVASFADRADRNIPANVYGGRRSNDPDLFLKDGVTQWLAWKERVKTDLENYPWMIKTDITAYFDALQHSVLFGAIEAHNPDPRILEALRRMLRAWTVAPSQGIPQGPNASRFLQNVYFLPIDQEMIAGPWRYYRFIDDIRILGHTRAEPKAGLKILERECKRRGLVLSVQKTKLLEGEDAVRDWDDAEIDAASYLMRVGRQKEARRHLRRILSRAIRGRGDLDGRQARFSLWRLMILRDDRALRTVLSDIEDLGPLSSRLALYLKPFLGRKVVQDALKAFLQDGDTNTSPFLACWLYAALLDHSERPPDSLVPHLRKVARNRNLPAYLRVFAANVLARARMRVDLDWIRLEVRSEYDPELVRGYLVALARTGALDGATAARAAQRVPHLKRTIRYLRGRSDLPSVLTGRGRMPVEA
ncbi:MAG: RNA-directed DNA polymerase [Chloroflexi bacterium]|nr:MAG: RNA-directed DNA polymerase [Chloroflexota bacterium]